MLPAPAPGEDAKDLKSHAGPRSRLWAPCWRHAGAAAVGNVSPWSQGAVPATAAQKIMVLLSGLRLFLT